MGNRASHLISTEWIFEVFGFLGSVLNQKDGEQNWFAVGMKATSKDILEAFGVRILLATRPKGTGNRDSSMEYRIYHGILTANGHFRSDHDIRNE